MRYSYGTVFALALSLGPGIIPAIAQIQPNTGTIVTPVGNRLDIEGTQVSGKNQFHNFQTFNVNPGQTANFIPNNVNIQNILSRVSGGTPSQIQGVIQSTNGINLFLMNPSGILFGNGASLNINGSFTATTANAIGFGGNLWFSAAGTNDYTNLNQDPNQFAFTSNNSGAMVNTGTLTLPANKSLNLIGGTVINTGTLSTPGGNITIAAVEGGKFIQIKTPGNILSYTLSAEAINSVNPAIGSPVSLPELLTGLNGATINSASGIEIKNGVITLVRSQTPLQDRSGLAVVSGSINTTGVNGGNITVLGKTIAIADPSISAKDILFDADRRLVFEDQADNELAIRGSTTFKANSTNGIIEAIDLNDKILIYTGPLNINASTIKLGHLATSDGAKNKVGINLTATNNIQVGDVSTQSGAIEVSTTTGDIKMGNVYSYENQTPTKITTNLGNVEVDTLTAYPNEYGAFALDIFAGGTFRAIGTNSVTRYKSVLSKAGKDVFNFLNRKTELTQSQFDNIFTPYVLYTPMSIVAANNGTIRIRHAGGGGPINRPIEGLEFQGGNARFEVGAKEILGIGDPYVPTAYGQIDNPLNIFNIDPSKSFQNFIKQPFAITKNATYTKLIIPEGASGTVGAIVRIQPDGSLSIGAIDQAFGILPIKPDPKPDPRPDPKPDPKIPPIDLETRNTKPLATCPQSQTIASATLEPTRSPDRTTDPNAIKNPCKTNDDDEILKILK